MLFLASNTVGNLSKNFVTTVENLSHCKILHTLILSFNNLKNAASIEHCTLIPELHALDIQSCKIDDTAEAILDVLSRCKEIKVLYLKGNECVKRIKNYRKMVISTCPNLKYLDDRPVFYDERRRCDRWRLVFDETGDSDKAMEAEREEITAIRDEKREREERAFKQFEEMVREGQVIKEANRQKERDENGGELGQRSMVSTDAKSFSVDGVKLEDEKKMGEVGKYIHMVDRDKDGKQVNMFSGEPIIPTKESELVANARKERWGPGSESRVLSQNVDVTLPPPPPRAKGDGDIWGGDEVMTEEARKEAEIEAYYTSQAGDVANWEKGTNVNDNAAAMLDSGMAAELAMLQDKTEKLNAGRIVLQEERAATEALFRNGGLSAMPPQPPPAQEKSLLREIGGSSQVGVGGKWPTKEKAKTDFEELD